MALLVCYDIEDNRMREKFSKLLLKTGLSRIQLSVFIGNVRPELTAKVTALIQKKWINNSPSDKLYMIHIPDDNIENCKYFGEKPDWEIILGKVKYRIL